MRTDIKSVFSFVDCSAGSDICSGRLPVATVLSNWENTKAGKIKDMPEGLNIPSGVGTPRDPPARAESSAGEMDISALQGQRAASIEEVLKKKRI